MTAIAIFLILSAFAFPAIAFLKLRQLLKQRSPNTTELLMHLALLAAVPTTLVLTAVGLLRPALWARGFFLGTVIVIALIAFSSFIGIQIIQRARH